MRNLDKKIQKTEKIVLFKHITSGGAIYYTNNHDFSKADSVIRCDGNEIEVYRFLGEQGKK